VHRRLHVRPRLAVALLFVAALLAGTFLLARQSSLVEVRQVTVTGLTGPEGPEVRRRLTAAAREMTTLAVDDDELREVAARFPVVEDVEAEPDLPHGLRITVRERTPVAVVGSTLVAGDGRLLRGAPARPLPTVRTGAPAAGSRLTDPRALAIVGVLAGAPRPLLSRIATADAGRGGIVFALRDGPQLRFGAPERPRAKWAAAAAVLADETSRGATYVDVRLPERPAAGGLEDPATQSDPNADAQAQAPTEPQPLPQAP
jgi:cell division protein FtsQ